MQKAKTIAKKLLPGLLLALAGCVYPESYSPYSTYGAAAAYPGYYPGSYPGYYGSGISTTYIYGGSPYYYYPPNYRGREWHRESPPFPHWHNPGDPHSGDHHHHEHHEPVVGGSTGVIAPTPPVATTPHPATPTGFGGGHHREIPTMTRTPDGRYTTPPTKGATSLSH